MDRDGSRPGPTQPPRSTWDIRGTKGMRQAAAIYLGSAQGVNRFESADHL
jgi:hypothetical protein